MQEHIARITAKLEQARRKYPCACGTTDHSFRLNPPLSERQVAAFEWIHGIRLPEAYRQFLLQIGNGGAGPYRWLLRLDQWDELRNWCTVPNELTEDEEWMGTLEVGSLADLCPLYPGMTELRQPLHECIQGMICLVYHSCTHYTLLVVSGAATGRVVNVTQAYGRPIFTDDLDFLAWYERWLDEVLAGRHSVAL